LIQPSKVGDSPERELLVEKVSIEGKGKKKRRDEEGGGVTSEGVVKVAAPEEDP